MRIIKTNKEKVWILFRRMSDVPMSIQDTGKETAMKGYVTYDGYMGYINGNYMLFASESDYEEYMGA